MLCLSAFHHDNNEPSKTVGKPPTKCFLLKDLPHPWCLFTTTEHQLSHRIGLIVSEDSVYDARPHCFGEAEDPCRELLTLWNQEGEIRTGVGGWSRVRLYFTKASLQHLLPPERAQITKISPHIPGRTISWGPRFQM